MSSAARNLVAYWLLGLCNNFAYVIMLSAAKDILEKGDPHPTPPACNETITHRSCAPMSTGSVLLADIIPSMVIKLTAPFLLQHVPFDVRHAVVVLLQACSFVTVAVSSSTWLALMGAALASCGSGLGEVSYLSMSSYYPSEVITAWSSGTGGAGVFGALAYAMLTDTWLLGLSPKHALLTMLIVPVVFAYAFWFLLRHPAAVHRVKPFDFSTYSSSAAVLTRRTHADSDAEADEEPLLLNDAEEIVPRFDFQRLTGAEKWAALKPLFRYMLPLCTVYFGEYFINQGLLEMLVFDCTHGFYLSPAAQYRWFQVMYQVGVFISRTAGGMVTWLPPVVVLAVLQLLNASFLTSTAIWPQVLPHFGLAVCVVLYEGLLGGSAYVWTFKTMHKEVAAERREFAMGFVSIADTTGVSLAGVAAIPAHNLICALPL